MNEDIIVTARRVAEASGSGSGGWMFSAVAVINGGANVGGGGGGGAATSIPDEAALNKAIKKLSTGDRIIIRVPGLPEVRLDGVDKGRFFEQAFQSNLQLMLALSDGRLMKEICRFGSRNQAIISDLAEDFKASFDQGKYVRITNTNDLLTDARKFDSNANFGQEVKAFTVPKTLTDDSGSDYHQVYIGHNRLSAKSGSVLSQNGNTDYSSIGSLIFHELFHIVEIESSAFQEYAKYGLSNDNHNGSFERAAADLMRIVGRMKDGMTFDAAVSGASSASGGEGNDTMNLVGQAGGSWYVDAKAGQDVVTVPFSHSVVDTGSGNDVLSLAAGNGRVFWFDESGLDTLILGTAADLSRVAVERFGGWTYVGVLAPGQSNMSAAELTNVVMFETGKGPESVQIASATYAISSVEALANSKPDFLRFENVWFEAPFFGGLVQDLPAVDADGDTLTYSVLGVSGIGAGSQWYFSGHHLYTNVEFSGRDTRYSHVTVRVSDGRLHRDTGFLVEWRPDPFSDVLPYRAGSDESDRVMAMGGIDELQRSNVLTLGSALEYFVP